ncbi:MAG: PDZ domain-containing protein [Verrucomicrobia bacterium]|nr:PDZ domain-containing protein [Verrucomicrobiota bacterium]
MKALTNSFFAITLVGANTFAPLLAAQKESAAISFARQLNQAFIEVADQVSPSVVVIRVAQKQDRGMFGMELEGNPLYEMLPRDLRKQMEERLDRNRKRSESQPERTPQFNGQGSGVVIREDGYILTNRHVVEDAQKIEVRFKDGRTFPATIRGLDPRSDVAVLKIEAKGLPAAKFTDSDKTRVGEFAIAIGAPFNLDYSVTFGHVSAKGRTAIIPDAMAGLAPNTPFDQDFIQTDATINPGNSGGPLVNINGEIIGINTLIRGIGTGIGFAIPANLAREVSESLILNGRMVRAKLGLLALGYKDDFSVRDGENEKDPDWDRVSNQRLRDLNGRAFKGATNGIFVAGIQKSGAAGKSALKLEDVVTHVEGTPISNAQELRGALRTKAGKLVTLSILRDGKPMKIKVTPEEWADEPQLTNVQPKGSRDGKSQELGLTVKPLTPELAKQMKLKQSDGLLITEVEPGGPAARRGLKPGVIITEINGKPVSDLRDFAIGLKESDLKKGVRLEIIADGSNKFEVLRSGE